VATTETLIDDKTGSATPPIRARQSNAKIGGAAEPTTPDNDCETAGDARGKDRWIGHAPFHGVYSAAPESIGANVLSLTGEGEQ